MNRLSNRVINIAIHALVWIAVILLPTFLEFLSLGRADPPTLMAILIWGYMIGLCYINYFIYIEHLLIKKRRIGYFILANFVTVLVFSLLVWLLRSIVYPDGDLTIPEPYVKYTFLVHVFRTAAIMIFQFIVVGICVAVKMTQQWYKAQRMLQEQEKASNQAELQHLKSQLNPHFLFNSLNNIYALIGINPDRAQLSLQSLCDLLRYQLYEANREMITLQKEVEFVRSYCELMSLRMPKNVKLDIGLPDVEERVMIAPLLFISVIEYAFKHGISQSEPSHIGINISLNHGRVECKVCNTNFPKSDADRSGSGIGLENLRRRLELLYPKAHTFRAELEGDEFVALLTINLHHERTNS